MTYEPDLPIRHRRRSPKTLPPMLWAAVIVITLTILAAVTYALTGGHQ